MAKNELQEDEKILARVIGEAAGAVEEEVVEEAAEKEAIAREATAEGARKRTLLNCPIFVGVSVKTLKSARIPDALR